MERISGLGLLINKKLSKEVRYMSIKPIDFQVAIPKTGEIAKIKNDEQQRNQSMQQQQVTVNQHKAEHDVNSVHAREDTQNAKIRDKQSNKDNNEARKKKKMKETGKNGKQKNGAGESVIDIRL